MHSPGRTRRNRSLGALIAAGAAALLTAQTAFAAVDWGPVRKVSPAYTYNFGGSLARSTKGDTSYLHAAYTAVRIGGDFVDDNGPFAGVYYRRGNSSGSDWKTPKRLNPTGKHAEYGTVISSGRNVYAAYVSIEHWINYDPAEPRPVTMRINTNHGAASAWLSRKITTLETRIDRPALAPWGTRGVVMTYTNADTGDIFLMTCGDLSVEDSGCAAGNIGTTTRLATNPDDGFEGLPVVATSGGTIAVAWLDATEGGISYTTKVTEGDWTEPASLTTAFADGLSAAGKGGRFAFAWTEDNGVKLRMWSTNGGLDPTRTVASVSSDGTYKAAYSTAVALAGEDTVGVAFAACRRADCGGGASTGVDLRWRQSGNDGSTWGSASTVGSYAASSSRRINDFPSAVMSSTTKRYVTFTGLNKSFTSYRIFLRVGTG